ncbi:hypothetical protein GF362_07510 [Candidatus Dojkabacteria bacterium]|nr:hypothetical protein [Candidatus Dojkabacteria bacterium]
MSKKKNYTIVQFETDDFYHYTLDLVLYNMNQKPAIKVTNKKELRKIVKDIQNKKIKPDVAIIDTYIDIDHDDGEKIAQKLREIYPEIKIIGYSIMETSKWADYEIIKSNKDQTKTIVKILEKVLGIDFSWANTPDPEYST